MDIYGGVEAGGTKFVCIVAGGPQNILAETRFPTTDPEETLRRTVDFFKKEAGGQPLKAIGIGSFGPLDLDPKSPTFGYITSTPKPGWQQVDITGRLSAALQLPAAVDTDVNAAAFGEYIWGNPDQADPLVYYTIGTGIGAGLIVNGQTIHGLVHPEAGHVRIPHDRETDPFEGVCPYHGDCFEGLCTGVALSKRWGQIANDLPDDHPAWELEAHYIALALVNQICMLSPRKIVLGGGVMQRSQLFPIIRREVVKLLNGYVQSDTILKGIDRYIVPPALGTRSGVLGAIALAQQIAGK
jgi:fructokinase